MAHQTFFKEPKSGKVERAQRRMARDKVERDEKALVRKRDGRCRFPFCGCKAFRLRLEVSHSRHKGMGGDPGEERSKAPLMVLLCAARHKENRISIDRGTLKWEPMTDRGADGPVAWFVSTDTIRLVGPDTVHIGAWVPVAAEQSPGVLQPLALWQHDTLRNLAKMEC